MWVDVQMFCGAIAVDFTVYNFAIANSEQNKWFIQKRYSQFDNLDVEVFALPASFKLNRLDVQDADSVSEVPP